MGGIDESRIHDMTSGELSIQMRNAVEQAGRERLILAPGCTLPAWVPAHQLRRLREEAHSL
jgi:uroporphyrinogen decarboxylase